MQTLYLFLFSCFCPSLFALTVHDSLFKTPAMGWNTYNFFREKYDENILKKMAMAMVHRGLRDVGYKYLNIDDFWLLPQRNESTLQIVPDPAKFPSGIKALADFVHNLDMKLGVYLDAGTFTCGLNPGSLNYERVDSLLLKKWDIDYLKYDNCFNLKLESRYRYSIMAEYLRILKKPILYSLCQWGEEKVWDWGKTIANSWRTTTDICNKWRPDNSSDDCSVLSLINKHTNHMLSASGPGGFNDLDMLEVGNHVLTYNQSKAHFSLWAAFKSPLILGNDLIHASDEIIKLISNRDVIAINQDPLGKSVQRVYIGQTMTNGQTYYHETYLGPLANGDWVLIFFNQGVSPQRWYFDFTTLSSDIKNSDRFYLKDLWSSTKEALILSKSIDVYLVGDELLMYRVSRHTQN